MQPEEKPQKPDTQDLGAMPGEANDASYGGVASVKKTIEPIGSESEIRAKAAEIEAENFMPAVEVVSMRDVQNPNAVEAEEEVAPELRGYSEDAAPTSSNDEEAIRRRAQILEGKKVTETKKSNKRSVGPILFVAFLLVVAGVIYFATSSGH